MVKFSYRVASNRKVVFIRTVEINSKETKLDTMYALHFDENNIRITYSGTAFRDPKSLMYRYKLIPVDAGWNTTFSNSILYADLSPGNYQFVVQVRKGDFTWSTNAASLIS